MVVSTEFLIGDALAYLRSNPVCLQVHLTLRNLPLQIWTSQIMEQVLSPYCILEYIDQETRIMDDSLYVVSINVSEDGDSVSESAIVSVFPYKCTIFWYKAQYIYGLLMGASIKVNILLHL
jgi:hypothetical protein